VNDQDAVHDEAPPAFVTPEKPGGEEALAFDGLLREFRHGEFNREVSIALHELIADVTSIEKDGSLTIKIGVGYAGDMQVEMGMELTSKNPNPKAATARYYVNQQGQPTRTDPRQGTLPL
jgi:hypothetical protein